MNETRGSVEERSGGHNRVLGRIELCKRRKVQIRRQGCKSVGMNIKRRQGGQSELLDCCRKKVAREFIRVDIEFV